MSDVKHTPGPWVVCNMDAWCCVEHTEWGTTVAEIGENDDLGLADARLIAAAPDLLEACRDALGVIEATGRTDIYDKMFAAIAKAKEGA